MTVLPKRDLRLSASATRLTLKEGERLNITLKFVNRGNTWENGTLNLSGDFRSATLNMTSLNITPFSECTAVLTVDGRRPGGNVTVRFVSPSEGPRAEQNISVAVTVNTTGNATGQTPPANALLVMAIGTIALAAVLAFVLWDLRRHEEREMVERAKYERRAARRPKSIGRPPPPDRKGTGKGP
jgi:hypothetical protein